MDLISGSVDQTSSSAGEDRAVSVALPRPRRRLPASIREPEDGQVRVCARLRQRMGAGHLREAAHQMRRVSQSSLPSCDRRRHSLAPVRPRRRRDSPSSPASIRCFWMRRASSSPSISTRPAGSDDATAFLETCRRLDLPAALERSRSGRGGACLALLRGGHSGCARAKTGLARPHRDDGATAGHRARFVRPSLSESGHDAARRIRKPDRPAAAEEQPREHGQQRLSRRAPLSRGPINGRFSRACARSAARRSKRSSQDAERRGRILGVRLPPQDDDEDAAVDGAAVASPQESRRSSATCLRRLELVLGNQIYIAKDGLHPGLRNRLLRLAAFQNPEFYKAQAMRLSTYDKPRVIACAEDHPHHIGLPRGCLDDVRQTLTDLGIRPAIRDERYARQPLDGDLSRRAPTRAEGGGGRDAAARHRRPGRHDGVRQDRRRRLADRPARRQYAGARASPATARPMDRASGDVPGPPGEVDRPHRRRTKPTDRAARRRRSFRASSGKASWTIASPTTAM